MCTMYCAQIEGAGGVGADPLTFVLVPLAAAFQRLEVSLRSTRTISITSSANVGQARVGFSDDA